LKGNSILKFFAAVAGLKPSHFISSLEGAVDHGAGVGRGNLLSDFDATAEESLGAPGTIEEFPVEKRRFRRSS
jgi:hypothetical protein